MKLLISLIDAVECGGLSGNFPDFVDVKNPADGSLGMPDISTVKDIKKKIPDDIPMSVAIGDARDDAGFYGARAARAARAGADVIKVGLYAFEDEKRITQFLSSIALDAAKANESAEVVAALYADLHGGERIRAFPALAQRAGIRGCLIDTYKKDGRKLTDCLNIDTLEEFVSECRSRNLLSAVAGGLDENDFDWLLELDPDVAGFRSAVCKGSRDGVGIDGSRVKRLLSGLRQYT